MKDGYIIPLLSLVLALMIVSLVYFCNNWDKKIDKDLQDRQFKTITIDDCEYIKCYVHSGVVLVHKGNCKNHNK